MKKKIGLFLLVIFCFMLNPQSALAKSYKCDYDDGLPDESLWIFDRTTSGKPILFDSNNTTEIDNKVAELINESGVKGNELYSCCPEKKRTFAGNSYKITVTQQCDVWRKKEYIEPTLNNVKRICRYNFNGVNGENFTAVLVQTADENGSVKLWDRTKGNTQNAAQLVFDAGDFDFITIYDNLESNSSITKQVQNGVCPSVRFYYEGGYVMTSNDTPVENSFVTKPTESQGTICTDEQLQPIKAALRTKYNSDLLNPVRTWQQEYKNWLPPVLSQINPYHFTDDQREQIWDGYNTRSDTLNNLFQTKSSEIKNELNTIEQEMLKDLETSALSCTPPENTNLQEEIMNDIEKLKNAIKGNISDKKAEILRLLQEKGISNQDMAETEDPMQDTEDQVNEDLDDYIDKLKDEHRDFLTSLSVLGNEATVSCEGLLGQDLLDLLHKYFGYLKIAAPILLIVMGGIDFGQAILSDDKEALKKAGSKFLKRTIACAALFFLPYILEEVLKYVDGLGTDPLCGIGRIVLK